MDSTFNIDSIAFPSLQGNTTMQSSLASGFDIPRFCYHEKLSIAGNCRMCLLEIGYPRSLKPMASCALPIISGMAVYTNTIMVKKAREGVLELLLINHPLDCPVCDQGGECDLQEQTQKYGGDRGRFYESKRAVEDKECGPIVKTSMNRCIHCTKCVRFCNEICGESVLGTLGRGSDMEIGTYVENVVESEFAGNLPDVCPVGALTSKPYAFRARPWELRSFETLDIIDSMGSRIRIDIRGTEVLRILPSQSEDVNEDWITDRTRYSYDGLKSQRLHAPLIKLSGCFIPTTWETAFFLAGSFLNAFVKQNYSSETYFSLYLDRKTSVFGIFGDLVDSETLVVLNDFFHQIGSAVILSQKISNVDLDFRSSYLLNLSLDLIEKADLFIFVGLNVRIELPLINLRIRKSFLHSNSIAVSFGFLTSLTYQHFQQGYNLNSVLGFLNGKSYVSKCLIDSKFPIVFVGVNSFKNLSYEVFMKQFSILWKFSNLFSEIGWNGLNLIDPRISSFASRDLGFSYTGLNALFSMPKASFVYLCGVETFDIIFVSNSLDFRIFHGHSGDSMAFLSDVVFPGCTFVEKEALYVTLEGKVQKTKFLLNAPSLARVDWKIITGFQIFFSKVFSDRNNKELVGLDLKQYTNINQIRARLLQYSPSFKVAEFLNYFPSHKFLQFFFFVHFNYIFRPYLFVYNMIFINNSKNFYLNNSITQISRIMGVCAGRYNVRQSNFLK